MFQPANPSAESAPKQKLIRQENLNAQLQEKPEFIGARGVGIPGAKTADKNLVSENTPAVEIQAVTTPTTSPAAKARKIPSATSPKKSPATNPELDALAELSNIFADGELAIEEQPVLLCNDCGSPLLASGRCSGCSKSQMKPQPQGNRKRSAQNSATPNTAAPGKRVKGKPATPTSAPANAPSSGRRNSSAIRKPTTDPNEAEFWDLVDDN
jgi:hypothetical protein